MNARSHADEGVTILEVVIALTIFAIVITGLATSTALGLRIVSASNGRQIASQLATKELEKLRRTPYANIGHPGPVLPSVGDTLDNQIVLGPPQQFNVPGGGTELMVITGGTVAHSDPSPTPVEGFRFTVKRYVTWVDDPSIAGTQDYKRVTIALQWQQKTASGGPSRVVLSSIFSTGKVLFP